MSFVSGEMFSLAKKLDYKGCKNCKHQIEPLRMCEWAEKNKATVVYFICPRWEHRDTGVRE